MTTLLHMQSQSILWEESYSDSNSINMWLCSHINIFEQKAENPHDTKWQEWIYFIDTQDVQIQTETSPPSLAESPYWPQDGAVSFSEACTGGECTSTTACGSNLARVHHALVPNLLRVCLLISSHAADYCAKRVHGSFSVTASNLRWVSSTHFALGLVC